MLRIALIVCLLLMQGIFLDAGGNVAEGPNMNVGIVTQDDQVVVRAHRSSC